MNGREGREKGKVFNSDQVNKYYRKEIINDSVIPKLASSKQFVLEPCF